MHALIIEDQYLTAALIEDQLRDLAYTSVETVDSAEDAIRCAAEQCPDLITADQRLASGSGVEAIRTIAPGARYRWCSSPATPTRSAR